MNADLVTYLIGSACYAISTVFGIRLRDELQVPVAAALAPAVAVSGLELDGASYAVAAPIAAMAILVVARRPLAEIAGHVALFAGCSALIYGFAGTGSPPLLVPALLATSLYAGAEAARQWVTHRGSAVLGDRRMWWLLHAVLLCASGLTILVVQRMGWPVFVAMAAVLGLTKREFEAFAASRVAYDQTVDALARLSAGSQPVR